MELATQVFLLQEHIILNLLPGILLHLLADNTTDYSVALMPYLMPTK